MMCDVVCVFVCFIVSGVAQARIQQICHDKHEMQHVGWLISIKGHFI